jgi:UDP-3-O-[3-hydroxymyristoyl] glucosamine N-acyltransferase
MPATNSKYSLSDLSSRFGLELQGDGELLIDGVGTLDSAGPDKIAFLANPCYRKKLLETKAGAVILKKGDTKSCPTNYLVAEDPYLAYARVATLFDSRPAAEPGIHPTAVISESSRIGLNVSIGPHVVIGDDCDIGDDCTIGPGTVLEAECRLAPGCRLFANVSLGHGVLLGARTMIHPGAVIGSDGFGIAFATDHWEKVPQLGSVVIGDDCEIGANTCIDRGTVGNTVLEDDVRIDNLCQIGHNVHVGAHTAIAGNSGIAGSVKIGKFCLLGGGSGVSGHLEIADRTTITGGSQVFRSISEPGTTWSGHLPSSPIHQWQRNLARLRKLDELARKVHALERQLGKPIEDEK